MSSWFSWSPAAGLLGLTPRCGRPPACCVADFDEICEAVDRVARFAGAEELIENSGRTFSYKVVPHRATWQSPRHEELYWHGAAAEGGIPAMSDPFKGHADHAEDESTEEPQGQDDASASGEASPCAESDPAVESPQDASHFRPSLPERSRGFRSWQPPALGLVEDQEDTRPASSPHWHQAETEWRRQKDAQQKHDQVEHLYAQLQELTQQKHAQEALARRHAEGVEQAKLEYEEATRRLRAAESELWQWKEEERVNRREEEAARMRREEEQTQRIEEEVEKRIQDKVQAELQRRLAAEERRQREVEENRRRREALEAERKRIVEEDVRRTYAREVEAQRMEEAEGERQRQRLLRRFCQKG